MSQGHTALRVSFTTLEAKRRMTKQWRMENGEGEGEGEKGRNPREERGRERVRAMVEMTKNYISLQSTGYR